MVTSDDTPSDETTADDPSVDDPLPLAWRAHDRTHLELPVPVQVHNRAEPTRYVWEAYFFVPESFRLDRISYGKEALDADFKSYVRLAVPETRVRELDAALSELNHALDADADTAVRALRLFACRVHRVLAVELSRLEGRAPVAEREACTVASAIADVLARFREVALRVDDGGQSELAVAARWIDEDMSLDAESTFVRLGQVVGGTQGTAATIAFAVNEARYRSEAGYAAVLDGDLDPSGRDMERMEFRRHTLKRFTSSILWLQSEAQDPSKWAKHLLYALAASFAMAFAVAAAIWNGQSANSGEIGIWLFVAVAAYAVKDRLKASLQDVFSGVLSKRFPDRRWQVRRRSGQVMGAVDERSGFAKFQRLPAGVLAARRITRQHPIEEEARPETVLWHQKTITVEPDAVPAGYAGLLEIFRVDLRRWLVHTDEANNRVLVADPNRGCIDSVVAPRVYNIAVVFRLRNGGSVDERWRRARVVVTRKGIRRIERIT